MAHIPMDDIEPLWNETPQHDWGALRKTLEAHKGKVNGISDTLVDMMIMATEELEKSNQPYPENPQQLHDVLNARIPKEEKSKGGQEM